MRQIQNPKPVLQLDKDGSFIRKWDSASQASKELDLYVMGIKNCCEQKSYVKSVGGYIWIYEEDKNTIDMNYYFINNQIHTKKIAQYDINMNLIQIWDSIKDACQDGKFDRTGIRYACNGKWKQYKNFIWKFTEIK